MEINLDVLLLNVCQLFTELASYVEMPQKGKFSGFLAEQRATSG